MKNENWDHSTELPDLNISFCDVAMRPLTTCHFFVPITDIDETAIKKASSKSGVERMLEFGRELLQLSHRLEQVSGINETNQKMLEVSEIFPVFFFVCNNFEHFC